MAQGHHVHYRHAQSPGRGWPLAQITSVYSNMCAGVQVWAEQAAGHVEEVATFRAGGLSASVRTIAHCGFTGTVAYSLIGAHLHLGTPCNFYPSQAVRREECLRKHGKSNPIMSF